METESLKLRLEEVSNLLLEIENVKANIKFLHNPNEDYFESVVKESDFFFRIYSQSIKLLVIDLCKVLDPSQDYSLSSIINFSNSNLKRIKWETNPTSKELLSCKTEVCRIEFEYLNGLKILRDKYFAHLDKNRKRFDLELKLLDCWKALQDSEEVFIKINKWLNGFNQKFGPNDEKLSEVLKVHRFKLLWHFIQNERIKDPSSILLDQIRDIMMGR